MVHTILEWRKLMRLLRAPIVDCFYSLREAREFAAVCFLFAIKILLF